MIYFRIKTTSAKLYSAVTVSLHKVNCLYLKMKKKILKIAMFIVLIILAVYVVRMIRNMNNGTPNQQNKGNPTSK